LPPKRVEAINRIGFGLLDKIVLQFPPTTKKFYPENLGEFAICHPDPSLIKSFVDFTDEYGRPSNSDSNKEQFTPILIQFLAGKAADRIDCVDSPLSDEEAVSESLESLRIVFGHDNVPDPIATKVTRWRIDPYAFGSYSFTKVGSSTKDYDEIESPIGNLLWAGEHTSKQHHSTVHGAWETGFREAQRVSHGWLKRRW
jgi:lysine-specific histone demethylase 1